MSRPRRIGPRMLAPSRILRDTPRRAGGGRDRDALVEQARQSIAEGSHSFAAASMLFDRTTRERAWLLYAWCRRCDDIADAQDHGGALGEEANAADAQDRIEAIRILTRRALEGHPTADIAFDAFGQVAMEAGLTLDQAEDVIAGFDLDAKGWRPRSEEDLMLYCYHVAGAVGVMMARVMGVPADDNDTLDRACDLGLAFQLANIARDLAEDDAADRRYLPLEWTVEQDIEPGQLMKPHHRGEVVTLVNRMLDIADLHEAAARYGAHRLRFRQRWAVLAAANIYGAIGRRVRALGAAAWDSRVHTTKLEKLGHVCRAFFEAMRKPEEPAEWPQHTRGALMIRARMAGAPAPMPMTPLRDED